MKIIGSIFAFVFLLLSSAAGFPQDKTVVGTGGGFRLDEKQLAVYLEFVRTGECYNGNYFTAIGVGPCEKKSEGEEKFEAVWIRFVNNTRWAVQVDIQKLSAPPAIVPGQLATGLKTSIAKDGAELDIIYDIESETGCDFGEEAPKGQTCKRRETPVPEYNRRGVSGNVFVPSGQSVLFAVNREHLKKYLQIYVLFNFEWELGTRIDLSPPRYEIQHRAYFSWYDAEQGIKKESEKKVK